MNLEEFKNRFQKVAVVHHPEKVSSAPVVSVCVTAYQHAGFIGECLENIINQKTNFKYEILLGEDASSDGTREICVNYANQYPEKIRLFLHDRKNAIRINGFPNGRFNFLYNLFSAQGKYIALCDGDDFWTDSLKLQKQFDFLEANQDCVMCYHGYNNRFDNGDLGNLKKNKPLPLTMFFRNDIQDMPDLTLCPNADRFLITYLSLKGDIKFLEEVQPSVRRVHAGGVMSSVGNEQKLARQAATWSNIYDSFMHSRLSKKLHFKKSFYQYKMLVFDFKKKPAISVFFRLLFFPLQHRYLSLFKLLKR